MRHENETKQTNFEGTSRRFPFPVLLGEKVGKNVGLLEGKCLVVMKAKNGLTAEKNSA